MRWRPLVAVFSLVTVASRAAPDRPVEQLGPAQSSTPSVTIRAARVFDGRGRTMTNAVVEVRADRIVGIDQRRGPVTHELGSATLLPGLIDVHVHLDWRFQPNGLYGQRPGEPRETPEQADAAIQANLDAMLDAGFTTVQSVGARVDVAVRDAIAAGRRRGPRVLTSAGQLQPGARTPDELRAQVRGYREAGADLIKTFASGSIRDGGVMNVGQAQLDAICAEARALGLRTLVHAHDPPSILAAVRAGCTQVEHGLFADDEALAAMRRAGVYFDPNIGLVLQNYLEHRDRYLGAAGYTPESFAFMERVLPTLGPLFARARGLGVRMPLGTDAVAGAHGRNARELVARVRAGGQSPRDALISATSLAAESLGLGDRLGAIAVGYLADLVAVEGDALRDISAAERVRFVMQQGRVVR